MSLLAIANRYLAAGFSIIPLKGDGSKAPDSTHLPRDEEGEPTWKPLQECPPTLAECSLLFKHAAGIAIICGEVSGNLEVMDFDAEGFYERWRVVVDQVAPGLVATLPHVRTPSGGRHVYIRSSGPIDGNLKLAWKAKLKDGKPVLKHGKAERVIAIETRGEGGYVVAPGSAPSVHPSGKRYEHIKGSPGADAVPVLSAEERAILIDAARSLNELAKSVHEPPPDPPASGSQNGTRPGDEFNQRATWEEILGPHGWSKHHSGRSGVSWTRPGKDVRSGLSATTDVCHGKDGNGLLYVFSSNASPFEPETCYSKFSAFAILNHAGDYSAAARALSLRGFGEQRQLVKRDSAGSSLVKLQAEDAEEAGAGGPKAKSQSGAKRLIAHARNLVLESYRDPRGESFCDVRKDGKLMTWAINSRGFKRWLAAGYYAESGNVVHHQAVDDVIAILDAEAYNSGVTRRVWVRVAEEGGRTFIDIGDSSLRVIEIAGGRWHILSESPVRFMRPAGLLPLPEPIAGGKVEDLDKFLNLSKADQRSRRLLIPALIHSLRPRVSRPIIALSGEHGTGKSTAARIIKMMFDPNEAETVSAPRDDHSLAISLSHSHAVAFDNLSAIPQWLSDMLCIAATGGSYTTRKLYAGRESDIFDLRCFVLLTAIEDVVTSGDLLGRTIGIGLERIDDEDRIEEREFWAAFHEKHGQLLGALLDVAAKVLANLAVPKGTRLPRMADFGVTGLGVERVLGWPEGAFMAALDANSSDAHWLAIEESTVAKAMLNFMTVRDEWKGTVGELRDVLIREVSEDVKKSPDWPKKVQGFSGKLKRAAPALRAVGVELEWGERQYSGRILHARRTGKLTTPTTPTAAGRQIQGFRECCSSVDGVVPDDGFGRRRGVDDGGNAFSPPYCEQRSAEVCPPPNDIRAKFVVDADGEPFEVVA